MAQSTITSAASKIETSVSNDLDSALPKNPTHPDADEEVNQLEQEAMALHERIAKLRLAKPQVPVEDYVFTSLSERAAEPHVKTRLSEMFGAKNELIVVHNMGRKCVYCTLWGDSLIGLSKHLEDRCAFVVTSPDDPETQHKFAAERGWPFRMYSTQGTTFKADMGFEPKPGAFWPGFTVFRKDENGKMFSVSSSLFGPGDPYCGLWHYLELLPGETEWEPKYHYQH